MINLTKECCRHSFVEIDHEIFSTVILSLQQHSFVEIDHEIFSKVILSLPMIQEGQLFVCLCWGLTTRQPLWVIFCRLPEKGRREIEEIVEEMKERDRGERGK